MRKDLEHMRRYCTDGMQPGDDCGAFQIGKLRIIASWGGGWEHVSVSKSHECPTWGEMNLVKEMFWDHEEAVFQLHPPRSRYVNNHPFCLHMWKPIGQEIPLPPIDTVGILGVLPC